MRPGHARLHQTAPRRGRVKGVKPVDRMYFEVWVRFVDYQGVVGVQRLGNFLHRQDAEDFVRWRRSEYSHGEGEQYDLVFAERDGSRRSLVIFDEAGELGIGVNAVVHANRGELVKFLKAGKFGHVRSLAKTG